MRYTRFARTGREVSRVGLGCWQLGADWGVVDEREARAILAASTDAGVTFLDTADVYGAGRSERIIGEFLAGSTLRDEIFVATKLGRGGELFPDGYTRERVRTCVEDSLRRLRAEALDLVQLHCIPAATMEGEDIWSWLQELKEAGKIREFGASVESMDEARICMDRAAGLAALQVIFNLFRQKPATTLFGSAQQAEVGIIARVPLASGLLSGRFDSGTRFAENDHRNYNRDGEKFNVGETFAGLPFENGLQAVEAVKPLLPAGMTLAQLALRWILDHEAVSVVIPGASRVAQARDNAKAADLPELPEDLHAKLREVYESQVAPEIRGPY